MTALVLLPEYARLHSCANISAACDPAGKVLTVQQDHLGILKRAKEHFKKPQAVCAMTVHNLIRVDDVASALTHFVGSG